MSFIPVFPFTVQETHCTQPKSVQSWVASFTDSRGGLKKIQVSDLFSRQGLIKLKNPKHTFKHVVLFTGRTKVNLPARPPLRGRTRQPLKMHQLLVSSATHLQEERYESLKSFNFFFVACSKVANCMFLVNYVSILQQN